jgi:hypothetical protein
LRDLLHPISLKAFLLNYWGKKPLFVKAAQGDRFGKLFDMDRFRSAVRSGTPAELRGSLDSGATYFPVRGAKVPARPIQRHSSVAAGSSDSADAALTL